MKRVNVAMPTELAEIGGVDGFFAFMRERHRIYNLRRDGWPRPWTKDDILHRFRFTNVYRELDKTTIWFRDNIRDRYDQRGHWPCMLAVAVFRWFNRIETGDALFNKTDAFDSFLVSRRPAVLKEALMDVIGPKGPFVTGAHMVYAVPGMPLVDGVIHSITRFTENLEGRTNAEDMANMMGENPGEYTIEGTWDWMTENFFGLGSFLGYELVTDLRHTHLLSRAPDIYTWANPGPGSTRGLNRVHGRPFKARPPRQKLIDEMRALLKLADGFLWPNNENYPRLEMRDIEHSLCEADKFWRVAHGEGYPRGVYR